MTRTMTRHPPHMLRQLAWHDADMFDCPTDLRALTFASLMAFSRFFSLQQQRPTQEQAVWAFEFEECTGGPECSKIVPARKAATSKQQQLQGTHT